jgi:hypothetical protein
MKMYRGLDGTWWYENEAGEWKSKLEAMPTVSKCERCKLRFKCFTTNTSNRPTQIAAINFEVAKCCIRCTNSHFTTAPKAEVVYNYYKAVGNCKLHGVLVHQLSLCDKFAPKAQDNVSQIVRDKMREEMESKISRRFPRFCLMEKNENNNTLL